jgi:Protein of unknown function (DUF2971)
MDGMDEERHQEEQTKEEPITLDGSATDVKVPEHLYKYRALDIRTLSALAMNRLFFVDYKLFNDPFDCQALRKLDREAKESLRKWTAEFDALDCFRVCPLSAVRDDVLMWGHYGDSHRGFCLEFGPRNDAAFRKMCLPVIYQPEYPDLDGTGATPEGMPHPLLRLLMTKSEQWRYESEWRMVLHVEAKEKIPPATEFEYDPSVLTGVIFGLRMPDDHKHLIRLVSANFKHLKFYQATRDEASYKIRIVPADPSPSDQIA